MSEHTSLFNHGPLADSSASQTRCPPGCPKCAEAYLAAKEDEERGGLLCVDCGQIAYPENYECACGR